ncbi:MAG: (2Fe-2S)-binding protein [Bacteriovorax sp.]|nr:(2Fe-2S)-binding protein [Bacteriovorax sp.]
MPTVLVHLDKKESPNEKVDNLSREYKVNLSQILYDELDRQGLQLPHGCLAGSCGSCRVHVVKGIENLSPMGVVETDTVMHIKDSYPGKIVRLSCRAKVLGDVEITPLK